MITDSVSFKRVRVFVSYSRSDVHIARRLSSVLDPRLFDVFFDRRSLPLGLEWEQLLLKSLTPADVLIVLVSKAALQSAYVQKEISFYLENARMSDQRKVVIPLILELDAEIPEALKAYQWLDFTNIDLENDLALRGLNDSVWGAVYMPERFAADSADYAERIPKNRINPPGDEDIGSELQQMWDFGQVALSPAAMSQLTNMGIVRSSATCAYREFDPTSSSGSRECERKLSCQCVVCLTGRCAESWHVYTAFCTIKPSESPFEKGTEFFYWCDHCRGPLCTPCLGIEDDYPCPIEELTSYRFQCPACHRIIRVIANFDVDHEGVSKRLRQWCRSQGPPVR